MSDISDVQLALLKVIGSQISSSGNTALLSPFTTNLMFNSRYISAVLSRGYPLTQDLDNYAHCGNCLIGVNPAQGFTRYATRFSPTTLIVTSVPITLMASTTGGQVTFTGTCTAGQVAGIGVGHTGYAYRMTGQDTPGTVAAAFAAQLPSATAQGASVTLSGPPVATVAVVSDTTSITELRRQAQGFWIDIWAPRPEVRDILGGAVSSAMAAVRTLVLPDGSTTGIPQYDWVHIDDRGTASNIWRRTERYSIEYPTTQTTINPGLLFLGGTINETINFGMTEPSS